MTKVKAKRTRAQEDAWAHSGLVGSCWMARVNIERITRAPTATKEARTIASEIVIATYALAHALKESRNG